MGRKVQYYIPALLNVHQARKGVNTVFAHTDGIDNERLLAYTSATLTQMKKRHERGIVPRPDWCSPVRWRIFAAWYRSNEDAKAYLRSTKEQKTDEQVWRKQIKMECDNKKAKKG